MSDSTAFVTKSYETDRERCELLCRSIRELAPGIRHYLVVDARDLGAFRSLESPTTKILPTEELLGRGVRRIDLPFVGGRNYWLARRSPPIRGWLFQQLAKLAIAKVVDEDVLVYADSDIALVRRFRPEALLDEDGVLRLYRLPNEVDESMAPQISWHRTAERLFGIEPRPLPLHDYVGGLVAWRREVAATLLDSLEERFGRDWFGTLARARSVSEFTLYGRFVDDVLGDQARQRASDVSYCRCYWGPERLSNAELAAFVDGAAPSELAVMVSAKVGMQPADYAPVFERRWAEELGAR